MVIGIIFDRLLLSADEHLPRKWWFRCCIAIYCLDVALLSASNSTCPPRQSPGHSTPYTVKI